MKLIAGLIPCGHFHRNEISFRVINCYVNTTLKWNHPKWNICACEYFITTKMVENKIIVCLFEKTAEKTMSSSEEGPRQPKRIIEKRRLGTR